VRAAHAGETNVGHENRCQMAHARQRHGCPWRQACSRTVGVEPVDALCPKSESEGFSPSPSRSPKAAGPAAASAPHTAQPGECAPPSLSPSPCRTCRTDPKSLPEQGFSWCVLPRPTRSDYGSMLHYGPMPRRHAPDEHSRGFVRFRRSPTRTRPGQAVVVHFAAGHADRSRRSGQIPFGPTGG